ncbi:unnamed protein product [Absidia cylindrospora]
MISQTRLHYIHLPADVTGYLDLNFPPRLVLLLSIDLILVIIENGHCNNGKTMNGDGLISGWWRTGEVRLFMVGPSLDDLKYLSVLTKNKIMGK